MLHHGFRMLILLLVLPISLISAELPAELEIVELSPEDRDALLAAPQTAMNQLGPIELSEAIRNRDVENVKVDKFTEQFTGEIAAEIGRDSVTTYQGWIRYAPVVLSDSRE